MEIRTHYHSRGPAAKPGYNRLAPGWATRMGAPISLAITACAGVQTQGACLACCRPWIFVDPRWSLGSPAHYRHRKGAAGAHRGTASHPLAGTTAATLPSHLLLISHMAGCLGGRGGADGDDDAQVDTALIHADECLDEHLCDHLRQPLVDRGIGGINKSTSLFLCTLTAITHAPCQ